MPKNTKLLTPEEYEKLALEEKAIYITDMLAVLKPTIPAPDPPSHSDGSNPGANDPPPAIDKPKEL